MSSFLILVFLGLFITLFAASFGDSRCKAARGVCQSLTSCDDGAYFSGLCAGAANRRCCIPNVLPGDRVCTALNGACKSISTGCQGGAFSKGFCKGPATRQCCVANVLAADRKCTARLGRCMSTREGCDDGGFATGLCSGPSNRKCCIPRVAPGDPKCTAAGGICKLTSQGCRGGGFASSLCAGPYTRRCCIVYGDSPCENDPCENGGTCEDDGDEYSCTCADGFTGRNCFDRIDDDANQPGCQPQNCIWNDWFGWLECINGTHKRTRTVQTQAVCNGACPGSREESRDCDEKDVKFYIITPGNELELTTADSVPNSYLNRGQMIRFVIHGWRNNARTDFNLDLARELYSIGEAVIVVDWSVHSGYGAKGLGAFLTYFSSCSKTCDVGNAVTAFIRALGTRDAGYRPSSMHLIGFSLGGKVSAKVGSNLNGKIGRITGLEVPLYCYFLIPPFPKELRNGPQLRPSRAMFVDTIRTTFLSGFLFQSQGHADFHVKCTSSCLCAILEKIRWNVSDLHSNSVRLYTNSVKAATGCRTAVAKRCFCPLPVHFLIPCLPSPNTMGFTATKPPNNSKYMVPEPDIPAKCFT